MKENKTKELNVIWWDPPSPDDSIPVDFCRDTSLHGLKYITQPRRHLAERIFWTISFLVAISVAAYLINMVWQKYEGSPIIVSFQTTETAIDQIPFPAITICNVNNVVRKTAEEIIKKAKELIDKGEYDDDIFSDLYHLNHICDVSTFTKKFKFKQDRSGVKDMLDSIFHQINTTALREMTGFFKRFAQGCEDMIPLCYWGDEIHNCSDLFYPTETNFGFCCTFNMVPTSLLLRLRNMTDDTKEDSESDIESNSGDQLDKEWRNLNLTSENIILPDDTDPKSRHIRNRSKFPRRQSRAGKSSGLTVLLNPDLDNYFCTDTDSSGFQLETHSPLTFPKPALKGIGVIPSSEVFMNVKPDLTVAADNVLRVPLEKRQCYFTKEMSLKYYKFYTSSNCFDECIANLTYARCKCVKYYMPRGNYRPLCGPEKNECINSARKNVLDSGIRRMCRKCLPLCTEVQYTVDVTTMPLRTDVNLWKYEDDSDAPWASKNATILHVYIGVDSVHARVRNQLYETVDLLSNTGGLLGFCLGLSGISMLEVIYFLTLRAWFRSRRGQMINKKISSAVIKIWKKAFVKKRINKNKVIRVKSDISNTDENEDKTWSPTPTPYPYKPEEELRNWVVSSDSPKDHVQIALGYLPDI